MADRRKHVHVTVHHVLVAMLEASFGAAPCERAGVDPASLLAQALAAVDALPTSATSLSCLDSEVLASMAQSEVVRKQLGSPLVDIRCMYDALVSRGHVPKAVGLVQWSENERIGRWPGRIATASVPGLQRFEPDEPRGRLQDFTQALLGALVPHSGSCSSVQGELVRAHAILVEELARSRMGNYYPNHVSQQLGATLYSALLVLVLDTLIANRNDGLNPEDVAYLVAARQTLDTDWERALRVMDLAESHSLTEAQERELRELEDGGPLLAWEQLLARTERCIGNWCIANPILLDKAGQRVPTSEGGMDIRSRFEPQSAVAPCGVCGGKGWRTAHPGSHAELCVCKGGRALV
jgi:hypothetical protein